MQTDMFDGIYDDLASGYRVMIRDGRLRTYVRRNVEAPLAKRFGMTGPWGTYPDLPSNLRHVVAAEVTR